MDEPRRRLDPLALAFNGVLLVLILAAGAYLLFAQKSAPAPAPAGESLVVWAQKKLQEIVEAARKKEAPKPPPAAKAAPKPAPAPKPAAAAKPPPPAAQAAAPTPSTVLQLPDAGRVWRYRVTLEPPVWRDATLSYRLVDRGKALGVDAEFRYAGGNMKFYLGNMAAHDPSHANVRFPGFFLYPAYLDQPIKVGQRYTWQWAWQLPDGGMRSGRVKRYEGVVAALENLPAPASVGAPAGQFATARIDATLSYVEDGSAKAMARETIWYAPRYMQIVKIVREGRTPDESAHRIVAELVELQ